eukprot:scaffold108776_cov32-Tisochrysis_lutea.AAC.2
MSRPPNLKRRSRLALPPFLAGPFRVFSLPPAGSRAPPQQHCLRADDMNNGLSTERALRGVFSTSSYITVGDPYGKKSAKDDREKGVQMSADFPKSGIAGALPNNALFAKEHKWLFGGEKYVDRTMYLKTQPPETRKKGFGSSDAKRRDEFSNDIEVNTSALPFQPHSNCLCLSPRDNPISPYAFLTQVEKWRERIKGEMEFAERFAAHQESLLTEEDRAEMERLSQSPERRWTHGPEFLFDLGKEAMGGTTPYEMKDARDTWYSKHRLAKETAGKQFTGGYATMSSAVGENLKDFNAWTKPEYARQPVIRDNFYRSTGVMRTGF